MRRVAIQYGLLIALAGACSATPADAVRVDVAMVDYRFSPDHLSLEHGVHYRLHLENHGKELHEFTAPTFFAAAKLENPKAPSSNPAKARMSFSCPARRAPMTCAAATMIGTAWWAALPSAHAHPLPCRLRHSSEMESG
jgi:hypothetical protein